jgi:hypothetical protein
MTQVTPQPVAIPIPTAHDRRRIAVIAYVGERTVQRAYRSDPVRSTVAARIIEAARTLGLPLPRVVIAA